jgi:membrane-associated phospholipid phosphatase
MKGDNGWRILTDELAMKGICCRRLAGLGLVLSFTAMPCAAQVDRVGSADGTAPRAEVATQTQSIEAEPADVRGQLKLLPKHIWGETVTFFKSPRTLSVLAAGSGVALLTSHVSVDREHDTIDQDFREHLSDPFRGLPAPGLFKFANIGASAITVLSGTVVLYGVGRRTHSNDLINTSLALGEGLAVNQILVQGLKLSVRRDRPDGGRFSFPSGHVTDTAMLATVLQDRWGWKASVPAYVFTAFTAYSRIEADRHWLSDTLFGGALGIATGLAVTRYRHRHTAVAPQTGASTRSTFVVVPVAGLHAVGVEFVVAR